MLMHMLDAGDHVVVSDDVYGGTFRIFDKVFKRSGLNFSFVDLSRPESFEAAITRRRRWCGWSRPPTR
jgi:cystathionine gamma-lyase